MQEDTNSEKLYQKFYELRKTAKSKGINDAAISDIFFNRQTVKRKPTLRNRMKYGLLTAGFLLSSLIVILAVLTKVYGINANPYTIVREYFRDSRCLIENNGLLLEVLRPRTNCEMCRGMKTVPVEFNISTEDFQKKYAFTAVPVLIKNATKDWSAMQTFSFEYLKTLYQSTNGSLEAVNDECQFLPYKTQFETLADAFEMPKARYEFREGEEPWYIGWSNCDSVVAAELRKHYKKPYFLPNDSESSMLDWIFMGTPGQGALIHLDYIRRPSWQAQISGTKTWTLVPTPECEDVCHRLNVTVYRGDMIVVDSNEWYHGTYIHPGDISITIGSEYD